MPGKTIDPGAAGCHAESMTASAETISIHLDLDDEHSFLEVSVVLPSIAEEVWESVATGPGYRRWFVEAEIEGRAGGTIVTHHGDFGDSHGTIDVWEPPHRYRYLEPDWMGEDQPVPPWETEITLTPVGANGEHTRATLRSGVSQEGPTWKDAILGTREGWEGAWLNLQQFHTHFADRHAAQSLVMRPGRERDDVVTALGLDGAVIGEERAVGFPEELIRGTVIATTDSLSDQDASSRSVTLRTADAVYEFGTLLMGGERTLIVRGYLYPERSRGLPIDDWETLAADVGAADRRRWEPVLDAVVAG